MSFEQTQLANQLNALVFFGTVVAVNPASGLVKVADGELTTDWIPYCTPRFGSVKVYSAPSIGETLMVLCESGDIANAVAWGSLSAGGGVAGQHTIAFDTGTTITLVEATNTLTITSTSINIVGNLTVSGTLTAGGLNLNTHTHPGDSGGVTGPPNL